MKEFEYCTQASLDEDYGQNEYPDFHGITYLHAWLTSCRMRIGPNLGYSSTHIWANQCREGQAFEFLPQDTYKA